MNADRLRRPCIAVLIVAGLPLCASAGLQEKRPNFVFLIGEGQGWSSLSVPMDDRVPDSKSALVHTPHLDRIAREGMRFTNFYAPSPRCTPSRAAFFTSGQSPQTAADLDRRLAEYLSGVGAQMPTLNPNPDPRQAARTLPGDRRGARGERTERGNGKARNDSAAVPPRNP